MARIVTPAIVDRKLEEVIGLWHNSFTRYSSNSSKIDRLLTDIRTILQLVFKQTGIEEEQEVIDNLLLEAFDKLQECYKTVRSNKWLNDPASMEVPKLNPEYKDPGFVKDTSPRSIRSSDSIVSGLAYTSLGIFPLSHKR